MSYQVAFCFWLLSFEKEVAEQINKYDRFDQFCYLVSFDFRKYDVIPLLIDTAQAAVKEKVIRVIVATFRVRLRSEINTWSYELTVLLVKNLVTKAPSANLPAMLVAQLLPFAKNLCGRKWSDEDVVEDVQFLRDELQANFQSLTYVFVSFTCSNADLTYMQHIRRVQLRTTIGPLILDPGPRVRRFLERECNEVERQRL